MIELPYELIGRAVVVLLAIAAVLLALGVILFGVLFVWIRGWKWLGNLMWKGYDYHSDEWPPVWKRRVALFAICMYRFDFRVVLEKQREIKGDDESKATDETLVGWLRRVYIND